MNHFLASFICSKMFYKKRYHAYQLLLLIKICKNRNYNFQSTKSDKNNQ